MNKIAVFFTLFLCCSCVLCGAQAYEIVWLGDMHYDSPDLLCCSEISNVFFV